MNERVNTLIHTLPAKIAQFKVILFIVLVVGAYGFVIWRATELGSVDANQSTVTSQTNTLQPHIDQATLKKIQDLQDNSVNVRTLFDQARKNPFKE